MATMADAVNWEKIPAGVAAVAGYVDGAESAWPAAAWEHFAGTPGLRTTVLADPTCECFDSEPGNASVTEVAAAVSERAQKGLPSVVYTNGSNYPGLTKALNAHGLLWRGPGTWPAPGPYLWCASPGQAPGTIPAWAPVLPVAVQNRWTNTYDLSTLADGWLPPALPSATPPPPPAATLPSPPAAALPYQLASDTDTKVPGGVVYVPTPTLDDARNALAVGTRVYLWDTQATSPYEVDTVEDLDAIEHTGNHAFPQYVTYTTSHL